MTYPPPPGPAQYPRYPPVPQHAGMQYPSMGPDMRAASADRERVVDVLKAAFAEGRLSQEEYNARMGRAYEAKTYGELGALTADLPHGIMQPMTGWQPAPAARTNSTAVASLVLGLAEFPTLGITAIPAIICGHKAHREIRRTGEQGVGMATAGLILGYIALFSWVIILAAGLLIAARNSGPTVVVIPGPPGG
jgi:Domain of unknown function (DUF1707)/Domain of unknown function (DUF4190)